MPINDVSLYELLSCVDIVEKKLNIVAQGDVTDAKNDDENEYCALIKGELEAVLVFFCCNTCRSAVIL